MASNERIKELRALGVKAATFTEHGAVLSLEFFPRDLLDVGSVVPDEGAPTDRPPPGDDVPPVRMSPAIAAILRKGSVS